MCRTKLIEAGIPDYLGTVHTEESLRVMAEGSSHLEYKEGVLWHVHAGDVLDKAQLKALSARREKPGKT